MDPGVAMAVTVAAKGAPVAVDPGEAMAVKVVQAVVAPMATKVVQ